MKGSRVTLALCALLTMNSGTCGGTSSPSPSAGENANDEVNFDRKKTGALRSQLTASAAADRYVYMRKWRYPGVPAGVAVDSLNSVYVVSHDPPEPWVQKFDSANNLISTLRPARLYPSGPPSSDPCRDASCPEYYDLGPPMMVAVDPRNRDVYITYAKVFRRSR